MNKIYINLEDRFYVITESWNIIDVEIKNKLLELFLFDIHIMYSICNINYYLDLLFPDQLAWKKLWLHNVNKQFSTNGIQCSPLHVMQDRSETGIFMVEKYLRNQLQG